MSEKLNILPSRMTESLNVEAAHGGTARQMESFFRTKINQLLQHAVEEPDKKRFVIDQIAASRETWFKGKEDLLDTILAKIETSDYATDAEFAEKVAREITNIVAAFIESAGLSAEEVQGKYRTMKTEMEGNIPLDSNGVIYCSRYEDVAELHITKGLTLGIMKEAMSVFVPIVQNDESIKTIKMQSWVVAEKVPYFRKLGFVVNEITDQEELRRIRENTEDMEDVRDKPIGKASVTREIFLNRYGNGFRNRIPK